MKPGESFSKQERLRSSKQIEEVFSKGKSFVIYPFRVVFLIKPDDTGHELQVLFSVAKKNVKLAVRRNRIKRLMKEAYRLNKQELAFSFSEKSHSLYFCVLYIGNEPPVYMDVEDKIKSVIQRLSHIDENPS